MKITLQRITLASVTAMVALGTAFGQQQYQYSQYMLNNMMVNPAVAGTEEYTDLKVGGRFQNIGFNGAPTSVFVSGHTALGKREHEHADVKQLPYFGVGGFIQYESTLPISKTQVYVNGAFHYPLSAKYTLSAGLSFGIQQQSLGLSASDGYRDAAGNVTTDSKMTAQNGVTPDGSAGIWFHSKELYAGISSRQLFSNAQASNAQSFSNLNASQVRDYLITAGYKYKVSPEWDILPSVLIKFVPALPAAIDITARGMYKNFIWFGATYRHRDGIPILLGVNIQDKYTIGMSYDITTSLLNRYSAGTIEFLLGYKLGISKIAKAPAQFY